MNDTTPSRSAPIRLRDLILALVEMHPGVTGYELRGIIDTSASHFFTTTISQIYPALHELRDEGLVAVEDQRSDGGRAKKGYTITPEGRRALDGFFATPIAYTKRYADFGFLLLLAIFLPGAQDDAVRARFAEARAYYASELARVSSKLDLPGERAFALLAGGRSERFMALWNPIMDYLVADYEAKLAWLDTVLATLPIPGDRK
jgi:DNA-binding PadR family transcriptional regulator